MALLVLQLNPTSDLAKYQSFSGDIFMPFRLGSRVKTACYVGVYNT